MPNNSLLADRLFCSVGSSDLPVAADLLGTVEAGQGGACKHICKDVHFKHCQAIQCCAQVALLGGQPPNIYHSLSRGVPQTLDKLITVSVRTALAAMPMFLADPLLLCRQIILHSGRSPNTHRGD